MPADNHTKRDDLLIIVSFVATVSAAVTAVRIDHNLATVATATCAVITALIGYFKARRVEANAREVAHISASAVLDTNAKTVLVQTVTAERAVWRREMRAATAELATSLRELEPKPARDWTRVDRLVSEIRLRLNPLGREHSSEQSAHRLDFVVHSTLDGIALTDRKQFGEHARLADALERAVAELLKQEWDKSKEEAVTGRLGGVCESVGPVASQGVA